MRSLMQFTVLCLVLVASTHGADSDYFRVKDDRNRSDKTRLLHMSQFKTRSTSAQIKQPNINNVRFDPLEIAGGYDAPENVVKHMAYVETYFDDNTAGVCTGSILNSYLIMCAAHCFRDKNERIQVIGGRVRIGRYSNSGTWYYFSYVDIHKNYRTDSFQNDIAIVWVDGPLKEPFSAVMLPNPKSELPLKTTVFAAGFGRKGANKRLSKTVLETELLYQPYNICKREYSRSVFRKWSPKRIICATDPGYPNTGGADTCSGDSGGPLYTIQNSAMLQQGITSFGSKCGVKGSLGWYTNLRTYVPMVLEYIDETYDSWEEVFDFQD